jgi:hypothetical protein
MKEKVQRTMHCRRRKLRVRTLGVVPTSAYVLVNTTNILAAASHVIK